MPVAIPASDLEFLQTVRQLGLSGKTQAEVAATLGLSPNGLRYRLQGLGFEMMPANDVRAILTGHLLSEMLEQGELVEAEDRQLAEVVA
jgi:hypothetical protein